VADDDAVALAAARRAHADSRQPALLPARLPGGRARRRRRPPARAADRTGLDAAGCRGARRAGDRRARHASGPPRVDLCPRIGLRDDVAGLAGHHSRAGVGAGPASSDRAGRRRLQPGARRRSRPRWSRVDRSRDGIPGELSLVPRRARGAGDMATDRAQTLRGARGRLRRHARRRALRAPLPAAAHRPHAQRVVRRVRERRVVAAAARGAPALRARRRRLRPPPRLPGARRGGRRRRAPLAPAAACGRSAHGRRGRDFRALQRDAGRCARARGRRHRSARGRRRLDGDDVHHQHRGRRPRCRRGSAPAPCRSACS